MEKQGYIHSPPAMLQSVPALLAHANTQTKCISYVLGAHRWKFLQWLCCLKFQCTLLARTKDPYITVGANTTTERSYESRNTAGEKSVTHIEIIHIDQNHVDAVEPINPINSSQPMMMAVQEQSVVID